MTVIASITTSVDGYIAGPTTALKLDSASAVSGCTTGSSAGPGRTTPSPYGEVERRGPAWLEGA